MMKVGQNDGDAHGDLKPNMFFIEKDRFPPKKKGPVTGNIEVLRPVKESHGTRLDVETYEERFVHCNLLIQGK